MGVRERRLFFFDRARRAASFAARTERRCLACERQSLAHSTRRTRRAYGARSTRGTHTAHTAHTAHAARLPFGEPCDGAPRPTCRSSASANRPWAMYVPPRLVMAATVAELSSPLTCRLAASTATRSSAASAVLPCSPYVAARLCMTSSVAGCSRPRTRRCVASTLTSTASASANSPAPLSASPRLCAADIRSRSSSRRNFMRRSSSRARPSSIAPV